MRNPIELEAIRRDISNMVFREISIDKPLNLYYQLAEDEIQSIIERLCNNYNVDPQRLWVEVESDRYFFANLTRSSGLTQKWYLPYQKKAERRAEEPFMIDDLVRAMELCRKK